MRGLYCRARQQSWCPHLSYIYIYRLLCDAGLFLGAAADWVFVHQPRSFKRKPKAEGQEMKGEGPFVGAVFFALVFLVGFLRGVAASRGGVITRAESPKTYWVFQSVYGGLAIGFFLFFLFSQ